jgi:hypothetical protein
MKKLTLTALTTMAAVTLFAQGTVNFQNASTSLATNGLSLTALPVGTAFRFALYFLPDQATTPTSADFDLNGVALGASAGVSPVAGRFSGGTRTAPIPGSTAAWFQVRAWETAFGDTYETALHNTQASGGRLALIGTSNIMRVTTGNPLGTPVVPAASLSLQGFVLMPVPEPSTIGLGLLGLGALLALRRRK